MSDFLVKALVLTGKHARGRVARVDSRHYPYLRSYPWYVRTDKKNDCYPQRAKRASDTSPYSIIFLHHEVMRLEGVTWDPLLHEIDHKDRDHFHATFENLRVATKLQNQFNKGVQSGSVTGDAGVWKTAKGRFKTGLTINGTPVHLGTYDLQNQGCHARNFAAQLLRGEFAALNPVVPPLSPTEMAEVEARVMGILQEKNVPLLIPTT